tara:strand:- start:83709 stop:84428 length:720 start_codon:yes stop_codon:yes gene_type:complete
MKVYGLIGKKLDHSFSLKFFNEKFKKDKISNVVYKNFEINDIKDFKQIINQTNIYGLNVTIPYKQSIIPYLDALSTEAKKVNSVNTIKINGNKLIGYNTDINGFEHSINSLKKYKKAIILGNGGSSQAVQYVLDKLNKEFIVISRNSQYDYSYIDSNLLKKYTLIINTTPLGMFPNIEEYPNIPYEHLNNSHFLYDIIYNPLITKFLEIGIEKGCKTKNGLDMLKKQAEASWNIWNTKK